MNIYINIYTNIYIWKKVLVSSTQNEYLVNSFIYPTGFVWLLHTSSGIEQDSIRNLFYTLTIQYKERSMCEQQKNPQEIRAG